MKRLALCLLLTAFASQLHATAQAPDHLKIGDQTYAIHTNPLASVIASNPERLPQSEVQSTGLWRG